MSYCAIWKIITHKKWEYFKTPYFFYIPDISETQTFSQLKHDQRGVCYMI